MSASGNKHVVRMGPITVLALVIVLSLATMAVLSLATSQAATRMADKQEAATLSLYTNEVQAQEFLAEFDAALEPYRSQNMTGEEALKAVQASLVGVEVEGNTMKKSFLNDTRTLNITLSVEDDLSYTIEGWKTTTQLEATDAPVLWQGSNVSSEQE